MLLLGFGYIRATSSKYVSIIYTLLFAYVGVFVEENSEESISISRESGWHADHVARTDMKSSLHYDGLSVLFSLLV